MNTTAPTIQSRECAQHGAECEREERARELERQAMQKAKWREERVANLRIGSGIPARFREATFTTPGGETPEILKAIRIAERFAGDFQAVHEEGKCLVLVGPPGTGKTHIATAVANCVMEKYIAGVQYTTVAGLARATREAFRKGSDESEADVFNRYATAALTILDELGAGSSQHERDLLFGLIDTRYAEKLPMILVSNLPPADLETYLGERAFDRLVEAAVFLPMTGGSRRRAKHGRPAGERGATATGCDHD